MRRAIYRFLHGLRGAGLLLFDTLVQAVPVRKLAGGKKRVLVVRLDALGDFLLWMDAARALRTVFPPAEYELTLLAPPPWSDFAREQIDADHIWTLNVRRFVWGLPYRAQMLLLLRRAGFDTLVQARPARELFVEDALTRASGAVRRIGFARNRGRETRWQKPISDRWYTETVDAPGTEPELTRSAALVRALGLTEFRAGVPLLRGQEPLRDGTPYYVLVPGAGWSGRRWPPERFAEIAARLHWQTGWQGVVCGSAGDGQLAQAIIAHADAPLEDRTGRTTLPQLASLIGGARLVVSTETGGLHMAAVAGVPSVCILGGGHFGRFVPYPPETARAGRPLPLPVFVSMPCFGCSWQCIYPVTAGRPVPCIENITTDAVWQGVQTAMETAEAHV